MKGNKGKKKNKNDKKDNKTNEETKNKNQKENNSETNLPKSIQPKGDKITLNVHAKPGSKKEGICIIDDECIEIAVHAQAQNNKANFAIIEYLSDILGISKSNVQFETGATNRDKQISVTGIKAEDLLEKLKDNLI